MKYFDEIEMLHSHSFKTKMQCHWRTYKRF